MKFNPLKFSIFLATALLFFSCGGDNNVSPKEKAFDRQKMLEHYADELIIPAYDQLLTEVDLLRQSIQAIEESPTISQIESAQNNWISAYSAWQKANAFNFGPAGEAGTKKSLWEEIGTFPVSESKINAILQSGISNMKDFNRDARGFLALEYLLFDSGQNQNKVIEAFSNPNTRTYARQLAIHLKEMISAVSQAWKTGYRGEFIINKGADAGSSTSMLYNEFLKSFESIKNYKLSLPMGKRPGQIKPEPALAEARYSGKSALFLSYHWQAIQKIWQGQSFRTGEYGIGFREYLEAVEGGPALVSASLTHMGACDMAIQAIPLEKPFSQLLLDEDPSLQKTATELQKQTRFFKSDMSSLLGIAITYASGDGD